MKSLCIIIGAKLHRIMSVAHQCRWARHLQKKKIAQSGTIHYTVSLSLWQCLSLCVSLYWSRSCFPSLTAIGGVSPDLVLINRAEVIAADMRLFHARLQQNGRRHQAHWVRELGALIQNGNRHPSLIVNHRTPSHPKIWGCFCLSVCMYVCTMEHIP